MSENYDLLLKKLGMYSSKDTDFPKHQVIDGTEEIPIVHQNLNKLMNVDSLMNLFNSGFHVVEDSMPFSSAIGTIPINKRMQGMIVGYREMLSSPWVYKRYVGNTVHTTDYSNPSNWEDYSNSSSNLRGFYNSKIELTTKVPKPNAGDIAFVGDTITESVMYTAPSYGKWVTDSKPFIEIANKFDVVTSKPATSKYMVGAEQLTVERAYADHMGRPISETYLTKCELIAQVKKILAANPEGINILINEGCKCKGNDKEFNAEEFLKQLDEAMLRKLWNLLKAFFTADLTSAFNFTIDSEGYLLVNGRRIGKLGTGVDGQNGTNGTNGRDGTNGKDGKDGKNGTNGIDGTDGKTPTFRVSNGWVQWKYTDESDSQWKNLYQVPTNNGGGTPNPPTPPPPVDKTSRIVCDTTELIRGNNPDNATVGQYTEKIPESYTSGTKYIFVKCRETNSNRDDYNKTYYKFVRKEEVTPDPIDTTPRWSCKPNLVAYGPAYEGIQVGSSVYEEPPHYTKGNKYYYNICTNSNVNSEHKNKWELYRIEEVAIIPEDPYKHVSVYSDNLEMGNVSLDGVFPPLGSNVVKEDYLSGRFTIKAIPKANHRFRHWKIYKSNFSLFSNPTIMEGERLTFNLDDFQEKNFKAVAYFESIQESTKQITVNLGIKEGMGSVTFTDAPFTEAHLSSLTRKVDKSPDAEVTVMATPEEKRFGIHNGYRFSHWLVTKDNGQEVTLRHPAHTVIDLGDVEERATIMAVFVEEYAPDERVLGNDQFWLTFKVKEGQENMGRVVPETYVTRTPVDLNTDDFGDSHPPRLTSIPNRGYRIVDYTVSRNGSIGTETISKVDNAVYYNPNEGDECVITPNFEPNPSTGFSYTVETLSGIILENGENDILPYVTTTVQIIGGKEVYKDHYATPYTYYVDRNDKVQIKFELGGDGMFRLDHVEIKGDFNPISKEENNKSAIITGYVLGNPEFTVYVK